MKEGGSQGINCFSSEIAGLVEQSCGLQFKFCTYYLSSHQSSNNPFCPPGSLSGRQKKREKPLYPVTHTHCTQWHVFTLRVVSLAEGTANYNASEMAGFQVDNMVRTISFFHYQMGWIM